jgi:class 3 adenylate cyclase
MDTYAKTRTIHDMPYAGRKDEIGKIAQSFNGVTKDIGTYIAEHQEAENKLAEKNQLLEVLSSKLSRYLSPQVYETIFSGQQDAAISTDRKKLTVFFSDIKDFTATTEDLEPEELTFLLNDYLTKMTDIALEYGATIDKYIGDAMLLFFGDPTTMGDQEDALACVKMAIAMQRRMVDLRAKWNEFGHERPIHMRIGINSGYCNVGNFGSEARMDYTIIGGEVNLAARLESIAEADGIMLAYGTYSLVKHEIDAKEQKPIKVKGIARDVVPYAVEGIFDDLDADRPYIRSESDAMRLYVDLRKLDEKGRAETAKELEKCAARLRET